MALGFRPTSACLPSLPAFPYHFPVFLLLAWYFDQTEPDPVPYTQPRTFCSSPRIRLYLCWIGPSFLVSCQNPTLHSRPRSWSFSKSPKPAVISFQFWQSFWGIFAGSLPAFHIPLCAYGAHGRSQRRPTDLLGAIIAKSSAVPYSTCTVASTSWRESEAGLYDLGSHLLPWLRWSCGWKALCYQEQDIVGTYGFDLWLSRKVSEEEWAFGTFCLRTWSTCSGGSPSGLPDKADWDRQAPFSAPHWLGFISQLPLLMPELLELAALICVPESDQKAGFSGRGKEWFKCSLSCWWQILSWEWVSTRRWRLGRERAEGPELTRWPGPAGQEGSSNGRWERRLGTQRWALFLLPFLSWALSDSTRMDLWLLISETQKVIF